MGWGLSLVVELLGIILDRAQSLFLMHCTVEDCSHNYVLVAHIIGKACYYHSVALSTKRLLSSEGFVLDAQYRAKSVHDWLSAVSRKFSSKFTLLSSLC